MHSQYFSRDRLSSRRPRSAAAPLAAASLLLAACSGDVVNLGENDAEPTPPRGALCQDSTTLEGSIVVENQEQLDELEGCEAINGDLEILKFPSAHLRSLHSLERVEGDLILGSFPELSFAELLIGDDPPFEDLDAELERRAELNGWLASLEGLERLEAAGNVTLEPGTVTSLEPLARLRYVTGTFSLISSELETLAGLETMRGFTSLHLEGERLRDITALRLPQNMALLTLVGPIEAVNAEELESVTSLSLTTSLQNLDAFEHVGYAESIVIWSNIYLSNLDGLNGITWMRSLTISDNDALTTLPEFSSLDALVDLVILGNENLRSFSTFSGMIEPVASPSARGGYCLIEDNPRLEQLALPTDWDRLLILQINRNAALQDFAMNYVGGIDGLQIQGNGSLRHVELGNLSTVNNLLLNNNPLLPSNAFDSVRTFDSHIEWNAPPTAP